MEINCLDEACPMPVIKTRKALSEIGESGVVSVLVDNIEAIENIEKMIKDMGYHYMVSESGGNYVITITKGNAEPETSKAVADHGAQIAPILTHAAGPQGSGMVIIVNSDRMGSGNDELGAALLKTFLYTLTESEILPKAIIFYNGGVKMTTEGSASIGIINALSDMGVDILSCGACLQYYRLTDSLKAGRISNMYEIARLMLDSAGVVTV